MLERMKEAVCNFVSAILLKVPGVGYLINLEKMAGKVINAEMTEFLIFAAAACFLGAYSLWGPVIIGLYLPAGDPMRELKNVLDSGQGYSFAISMLGVALGYIFREYRAGQQSEFKELKTRAAWLSLVILLFLLVIKTIDTTGRISTPSSLSMSDTGRLAQAGFVLLAVYFSVVMFCIQKVDDYPEAGVELRDKTVAEMRKKMTSASHKKVKV